MSEREAFKDWFAGAVKDAAFKAEGLAAYAFDGAGTGKLPPMITGDYKRGHEAFIPGLIRSVSLQQNQERHEITALGGAHRTFLPGRVDVTLDIEAYYDERYLKLFEKGEEFEIDIGALMKMPGGMIQNYTWRMQRIDMRVEDAGPPIISMTLYKVN